MTPQEYLEAEILWLEALLDSLDEGDITSAMVVVTRAIKLKREELREIS